MLPKDLLIIDDLEEIFRFICNCLQIYNIVNTRLMTHKPTIISTNLSMKELEERYTDVLLPCILGSYIPLFFRGKDIRQQKRRKKKCRQSKRAACFHIKRRKELPIYIPMK